MITEICTAKEMPHHRENLLVLASHMVVRPGHLAVGVVKQPSIRTYKCYFTDLISFSVFFVDF